MHKCTKAQKLPSSSTRLQVTVCFFFTTLYREKMSRNKSQQNDLNRLQRVSAILRIQEHNLKSWNTWYFFHLNHNGLYWIVFSFQTILQTDYHIPAFDILLINVMDILRCIVVLASHNLTWTEINNVLKKEFAANCPSFHYEKNQLLTKGDLKVCDKVKKLKFSLQMLGDTEAIHTIHTWHCSPVESWPE